MENYKIMYGERESHVKSYRVILHGPFDHDFGEIEVRGHFKNGDVFTLRRSAYDYSIVIESINYTPELFMLEEPSEWDEKADSQTRYVENDIVIYMENYSHMEEWMIIDFLETAYHRHYEQEYTLFDVVCDEFQINDKKVEGPFGRSEE